MCESFRYRDEELIRKLRIGLRGGFEARARHAAKLGFHHGLRADSVLVFGGEIDELARKGKAYNLPFAIGEGLVQAQQSPAHPMNMGRSVLLMEHIRILGDQAAVTVQQAAGFAAAGAGLEIDRAADAGDARGQSWGHTLN
jgi:hypothetical protein